MNWWNVFVLLILKIYQAVSYEDIIEVTNEILESSLRNRQITHVTVIDTAMTENASTELNDFVGDLLARIGSDHIFERLDLQTVTTAKFKKRLNSNIVIVDKMRDFRNFVKTLTHHTYNFGGFYVVLFKRATLEEAHEVFQALWDFYIHNLNLVRRANDTIFVETFIPFRPQKCNTTEPVAVASFRHNDFTLKPDNFYKKKFENFHQCPLKFTTYESLGPSIVRRDFPNGTFHTQGRDVDIYHALIKIFNFKPDMHFIEEYGGWGYFNLNGTVTHGMGRAIRREADFIIGGNNLKYDRSIAMSHTYGFYLETLVFLLPPSRELSSFRKLVQPFDDYVWVCVGITFLVTVLVIITVQFQSKQIRDFVYGTNVRNPCMNVLTAVVGGCQEKLPRRNFSRSLLMMFLLFCIVIRSVYQGALYNHLQQSDLEPDPATVDEIADRNLTFYVLVSWDELTLNRVFQGRRKLIQALELRNMMNDTLKPEFNGALMTFLSEVLYRNKLRSLEGLPLFKICKDFYTMIPIVIWLPKNSYLVESFNMQLLRLEAAGLIKWWQSNYGDMRYFADKNTFGGPKSLKLSHLSAVFQIWLSACLTGFGIFVFEMIFSAKRIRILREKLRFRKSQKSVKKIRVKKAVPAKQSKV